MTIGLLLSLMQGLSLGNFSTKRQNFHTTTLTFSSASGLQPLLPMVILHPYLTITTSTLRLTVSNLGPHDGSRGPVGIKAVDLKTQLRLAGWMKSTNYGIAIQERSYMISSQTRISAPRSIISPTVIFVTENVGTVTSCLVIGLGINV